MTRVTRRAFGMGGLFAAMLVTTGLGGAPASAQGRMVTVAVDPLMTLDPAFARGSGSDLSVISQIYSSLTTINEDGDLVGDLATKWEAVSPSEFRFTIREGAKFKNGKALDAGVVAWNIERMKNPETKATANTDFELIESATAPNPTTLVIKTTKPWVELPRRLSWMFLLEPEWTKTHNPKTEANPSGAYDLVSYNPAAAVVLKRNPDYYGKKPEMENVTYKVIPNTATRIAGLRSGELDGSFRIDAVDLAQLESLPDYRVGAQAGRMTHVLRFHMAHKAVSDVRVRQAINYAINKDGITRSIYRGLVKPATTQVLSPFNDGFNKDFQAVPYDKAKAQQLLKDAGYGNGLDLTIGVTAEAGYIQAVQATQAIAAQLKEVGINLTIKTVPGNSWVTFLRDKENAPDLVYLGYVSQSNSSNELLTHFTTQGPYSWGPVPKAFDDAVAAAKSASTAEEQVAAIRKASQVMLDEMQVVYLWPQPQTFAIKKDISWKVRSDDWVKAYDIKPAK